LQRIAEDHLRILRFFRFHARFDGGGIDTAALEACTARANDLMALSRERIADELLKLLAVADPSSTVQIMLDRGILKPVLPEIAGDSFHSLKALIAAESAARLSPDPIRRLAALLPRDTAVAESVAVRLRLSNKARKRLACAVGRSEGAAQVVAYRLGTECAVDRLLLAGQPEAARDRWLAHSAPPHRRWPADQARRAGGPFGGGHAQGDRGPLDRVGLPDWPGIRTHRRGCRPVASLKRRCLRVSFRERLDAAAAGRARSPR
jgi:hypothetical protein